MIVEKIPDSYYFNVDTGYEKFQLYYTDVAKLAEELNNALHKWEKSFKVITLEEVKENPELITDDFVFIYSNEHNLFWRNKGCGYTNNIEQAGMYSFKDAFDITKHCGVEKQIRFYVC